MDSLKLQASRAGQLVGKAPSAVGVMTARGSRVNTDRDKIREFFAGRCRRATIGSSAKPMKPVLAPLIAPHGNWRISAA